MKHAKRQERTQYKETNQATESDSIMTTILELSEQEFKIIMINMLRVLMEKVDNLQEQMGNVRRGFKILRVNPQEILKIKYTLTERRISLMDSLLNCTLSRKQSVSLKYVNRKFPNFSVKGKNNTKPPGYPKIVGYLCICIMGNTRKRKMGTEEIFEAILAKKFQKLMTNPNH